MSNGAHLLTLTTTDLAGNTNTISRTVNIETIEVENLSVMPGQRLEVSLYQFFTNSANATFLLASEGQLPTGMLEGNGTLVFNPNLNEIGTYEFTVIADEGETQATQAFVLNVVADPITTTRISGIIQNTTQQPLAGVLIELGNLQTLTNANGEFTIEIPGDLPSDTLKVRGESITGNVTYPFIAEKLPLLLERDPITGVNNVISRPIYLPPIDITNAVTINPSVNTTVTTANIAGASVFVAAGSLKNQQGQPYTGKLSITEVPRELTPAALPENLMPDLVVTIQPGEMVFTTPAPLSLPNKAGYAPGTIMDLWSINPTTGLFDKVGTGRVSFDGKGTVIETHDLVSYQSLGVSRGLTLTYDSERADSRPILNFDYQNVVRNFSNGNRRLMAELTVQQGAFAYQVAGGRNYWSIPLGFGRMDAALQADMRGLVSGRYDYELTTGLLQLNNGVLSGSTGIQTGQIIHVNSIGSAFGNGWGLSGLLEIVENADGSVLIIDGDGGELVYEALPTGGYDSPPGDFSVLEKLSDGTFQRTMKDQMVYTFNGQNKIASISDRNGNTTQYLYDSSGNLTKMLDPVGLETTLTYTNGKVTKITDPSNRETLLEYDAAGNLTKITDPDGTSRTLDYDGDRHITAETDKRGNYEQTFYDFAGRADRAILKDGSELDFDPVQVQGLYQPNQTTDPVNAPVAFRLGAAVQSVYVDANGNTRTTRLDQAGQRVSASDEVGILPSVERNDENLITRNTDARRNLNRFQYDAQGNVISILDSVSSSSAVLTGTLNLGDLKGNNGFILNGIDFGDESGRDVSSAGDVNGDGIDDLIIGTSSTTAARESYVVFGSSNGFNANFNLSSLNGTNGFVINPGNSVSGAGDINNDGIDDLIIGASGASPGGRTSAGQSYVVFGSRNGFNANFNLSSLNGTNGFVINGIDAVDVSGSSVSGAGDVNGDGIDDLIIGAAGGDPNGQSSAGESYVVFGSRNGFSSSFNLSDLDGINGFIINGIELDDSSGVSVSGAGDINDDGIDDLIIGAYRADPNGRTDAGVSYVVFGTRSFPKQFTYDPTFNQLTSYTDELGRQTLYQVDPNNGNVLSITQVIGAVGGNDDLITQFTYTSNGLIDTMTDPLGRIADNDYDAFGRLISMTYAVGTSDQATRQFTYDTAGNQTAIIDENGNRTQFEYDALNRLTKVIEADPDGSGPLTSPITLYTYDTDGNLLTTTDPENDVTTNEYDVLNRLTKTTDSLNQVTTFTYDSIGNLLSVVDPLDNETQNTYDDRYRLTQTIDPDGGITKFTYDLDNNLTSVTDPVNNKTTFTYDTRNRLIKETNPLGKATTYEYNVADNLTAQIDRNNRRIDYQYDDINRLLSETWVGINQVINYTYDKASNILSTVDQYSALTYTYDNRDRVLSVDNLGTPNAPRVVLNYTYDDVGNMLSVVDTINGATGGTNGYNYDALNRLTQLTQSGNNISNKRVNFAYNALGQFTTINRYSNLTGTQLVNQTSYSYDDINRLTNITHNNGINNTAFYNYGYDASNRITQITDIDGVTDYSYDDRDQLIGAERSNTNLADETYSYDANGNRTNTSYQTGTNNRLLSDGVYNYTYDNEGNLTRKTEIATGNSQEFTWDYRNRLTAVTDKDSGGNAVQRVEFTYDAFDRRIAKTVDITPQDNVAGIVTHFVYNRDDVHLEFVDNDGVTGANQPVLSQRYLHGAVVDQVLAQDDGNGNVIWMLTDHLGTIRDLVNENGTLVNHLTYDSFGQVIAETAPSVDTRYLFTGREFDEEIGLYYYRARYYDASTGRFIGEDPIGFNGGDSNLYLYVFNLPVNLTDPTGFQPDIILVDPNDVGNNPTKFKPDPNVISVYGHGNPDLVADQRNGQTKKLTPKDLADIIRNHPKYKPGMPVDLISCDTGSGNFAQELANELNAPVRAPNRNTKFNNAGEPILDPSWRDLNPFDFPGYKTFYPPTPTPTPTPTP